jgi:hypothetical protein
MNNVMNNGNIIIVFCYLYKIVLLIDNCIYQTSCKKLFIFSLFIFSLYPSPSKVRLISPLAAGKYKVSYRLTGCDLQFIEHI